MPDTQPENQLRLGRLKAAVWRNEADGRTFRTVSFSRLYRNEDDEWRSAYSFRTGDLLALAKLADRVHSRIVPLHEDRPPDHDREDAA